MVAVNYLAVSLPLNGKTTGELSDKYPNLFTPAGITFSIWSVIYLLLGIFVVYGLIRAWQDQKVKFVFKIGNWFIYSCIFNMAWIFVWHYEIVWASLVVMIGILYTLIKVYKKNLKLRKKLKPLEKYIVNLPFSIYLGWISVATIANVAIVLVNYNWNRFGLSQEFWTVLVMIVAILLGLKFIMRKRDIFYGLVIVWALIGIWIKRSADLEPIQAIYYTVVVGVFVLVLSSFVQIYKRKIY